MKSTRDKYDYLSRFIEIKIPKEDQNMAATLATTMFNSVKGKPVQGHVYQGKEPPQFVAICQSSTSGKG
ncbi:hypothetical protein L2E82_50185 [Cichorium intybus]|nr:hypothetical protein L2E82_50185 [Cichorium intybus]